MKKLKRLSNNKLDLMQDQIEAKIELEHLASAPINVRLINRLIEIALRVTDEKLRRAGL